METVLITGGAGFIGSHVTDALVENGQEIVVLDNLSTGSTENINSSSSVTFIEGDVRDEALVESIFRKKTDISGVIHLAAQSKVGPSLDNPLEDLMINVKGTVTVLEAARRHDIKTFVYASSAAVYGHVESLPISEEARVKPLSPYGASKLAAEQYVQTFGALYDMNVSALRFANVYGPRQSADTEAGVITIFIEKLLSGRTPYIQGDGEQTRDFVYVDDVVNAVITPFLNSKEMKVNGVFNVSSQSQTPINQLLEVLCKEVGNTFNPDYGPVRAGDIKHSYLSHDKLTKVSNWRPQTPLKEGLKRTVQYYRSLY
ncbi:SDR family NAD(P)-dependent oxidoreductase [Salipaludibacillus agaradhaerens]|jgi:UDP-glucose 4-epimerase|uniref:SDR family NAD(P)-dependent oxidoreductase n=1 Tax=Salipaludibacillus agaradhaerens TaxID=76935 RepID=UPI0021507824|nr:SDR family NAD(P)-dependent oxidoreductase [Salipaludibacillus agaradhaerens]MCR6108164.1 SDR family NAD(P)-dependent oxidoreductase [Salipaludibacillus agaradhaerens]MCR6120189.1 SDR family NAD(P)-dependent oxidoreductase [Salipaludibacillus agaradhaerens]